MSLGLTINHFLWFQHISRSGMPSTNLYKVEVMHIVSSKLCSDLSQSRYFCVQVP